MNHIKTRVCIIGSGIAGCLCAKYLSSRVDDILIVERGAKVTHQERLATRNPEKSIPTSIHHHSVVGEFRDKRIGAVHALGGSTAHWMGNTPRFLPSDFRLNSLYGTAEDWPLSYEELEPFYCLAEQELAVAGAADNHRTPRSKDYPLPAHPFSPSDLLFKKCFPDGSIVALPQARPTRPVQTRKACCGSAVCSRCPVDAKYTTLNTHIPQLEALTSVRILARTVVLSLVANGRQVRKAVVRDEQGAETSIEADLFILAANALENAAIILRSPSLQQNDAVGKYLFDHPAFTVTAVITQDGFPLHGQTIFTAHCYEFYEGNFRGERAAALGEVINLPGLTVSQLVSELALKEGLSGSRLRDEVTDRFRRQIRIRFLLEDLPDPENFIRIGNAKVGTLGMPVTEIFYKKPSAYARRSVESIVPEIRTFLNPLGVEKLIVTDLQDLTGHLMGTCRMAAADRGAVDSTLRYHEAENLYVLGGSAFPTYSPANPTLTIAALAIRLGSYLQT